MSATVIATDYHPTVLENLRANIAENFPPPAISTTAEEEHEDNNNNNEVGGGVGVTVDACQLDWSAPALGALPALDAAVPADVLVATDVVYAPEHAAWLRDCAARLLRPGGVFWLMATVRPNGKFEGISDTVRAAFATASPQRNGSNANNPLGDNSETKENNEGDRSLAILSEEWLEKRKGIGRGDESGYRLFRIGWA